MRVKRPKYFHLFLEDRQLLDLKQFLRGEISLDQDTRVLAVLGHSGETRTVEPEDLEILARISETAWIEVETLTGAGVSRSRIENLVRSRIVLSDLDGPEYERHRQTEEALDQSRWHPAAARFWGESRREMAAGREVADDVLTADEARAGFESFVLKHGPPPPAFHQIANPESVTHLTWPVAGGAFFELLRRRRTVRSFDTDRSLPEATLAALLFQVFGCHGTSRFTDEVTLLEKTCPSGGSLHPIEAYPLILRAEGIESGIYHYNVRRHSLDRLRSVPLERLAPLTIAMAGGQEFVGEAQIVILLTARFYRNFWKYRRSARTLAVIMMDAGHLGQTFYLTATELGLGAFYSAAIDLDLVEETLNLDGIREGAVAMCGGGLVPKDALVELVREPFDPTSER